MGDAVILEMDGVSQDANEELRHELVAYESVTVGLAFSDGDSRISQPGGPREWTS